MRTLKVGLIAVLLTCAVGACGSSGDGGFGGLGAKAEGTGGASPSAEKNSTARPTDDAASPKPTADRPTTSRPRTTTASSPASTGAATGGDWTSFYSTKFVNGCLSTSNNNTRYCQCALTELQAKYSQSQMNAFDQEYARTNKLPTELQSTVQKCLNT